MLKRSLATVVALGALLGAPASPVLAQDGHMWTWDRPDALQVSGIVGDRLLPPGAFDVQYTFGQQSFEGVQIGTELITFDEVLDIYATSPFTRRNRIHRFNLAYGATDYLTVRLGGAFAEYDRSVIDRDFFLFRTENDGLTDLELEGMLRAVETDNIRTHVSLGFQIPTGSIDAEGLNAVDGTALLPYGMQLGTGSFALIPGVTGQIQNEFGTVGAQVKARIRLDNNEREYRYGDEITANAWAAMHFNDVVAMHSGVRATSFGDLQGFDPDLDPARDPGEDLVLSSGTRVEIPLGINFRLTEGMLAGNTFGVELLWPVHENYDSFRLSGERSFNVTWRRTFGM